MRRYALLITSLLAVTVAARAQVTSADLVGEWLMRRPALTNRLDCNFTFGANHSFDYVRGDVHGAGKWKLHAGNKLELIYHYDYDRKPISSLSLRDWIIIDSIGKGRMRLRWYNPVDVSLGFQTSPEVWTKRR
jgi:hypothetical protein